MREILKSYLEELIESGVPKEKVVDVFNLMYFEDGRTPDLGFRTLYDKIQFKFYHLFAPILAALEDQCKTPGEIIVEFEPETSTVIVHVLLASLRVLREEFPSLFVFESKEEFKSFVDNAIKKGFEKWEKAAGAWVAIFET